MKRFLLSFVACCLFGLALPVRAEPVTDFLKKFQTTLPAVGAVSAPLIETATNTSVPAQGTSESLDPVAVPTEISSTTVQEAMYVAGKDNLSGFIAVGATIASALLLVLVFMLVANSHKHEE